LFGRLPRAGEVDIEDRDIDVLRARRRQMARLMPDAPPVTKAAFLAGITSIPQASLQCGC